MTVDIIGHAVVSADGMIAGEDRTMPAALRNDADWRRFQAALDAAQLVVLGRLGAAAHPNPGRRRLVVTSRVSALGPDPRDPFATDWNPAGRDFAGVLEALGLTAGIVAVTGGQRVFDLFLPLFTRFDLVEMADVLLPGGVPCFSTGGPAEVLHAAGLHPAETEALDTGVKLTVWRR